MIINFLGDSITQGAGASCKENMFVNLVGKKLDCVANNYGIGGTRIARQTDKSTNFTEQYDLDFVLRAPQMSDDADLVFVFGGTNDWGHGDAPIGLPTDTTPYTFYGALNSLVSMLVDKYGKEKLHFILPMHRYHDDNVLGEGNKKVASLTLQQYVQIIKNTLDANSIPYLNLFDNGLPTPTSNGNTQYFVDGVHPNDLGHEFVADKIVEYVKKLQLK